MKSLKDTRSSLLLPPLEGRAGAGLTETSPSLDNAVEEASMSVNNADDSHLIGIRSLTTEIQLCPLCRGSKGGMCSYHASISAIVDGQFSVPNATIQRQEQRMKNEKSLEQVNESGKKYDTGKARISILQGRALEQVMLVGEFGAKKYGDHNYRRGMAVTRFANAAFRHLSAWLFKREDNDPESGLPHLAHSAWNVLAALEQMLTKPELDDRWKE